MEQNEISIHEVRFYRALCHNPETWLTANDLATLSNIAGRTARAFALKFVNLGILDLAEVYPAHRYRLSKKASKRNKAYVVRLETADGVFAAFYPHRP
jgi:hypothetical protein